ncbi:MAG: hypothetical protein WDN49_06210 [Acetobacteraceae bacterium]
MSPSVIRGWLWCADLAAGERDFLAFAQGLGLQSLLRVVVVGQVRVAWAGCIAGRLDPVPTASFQQIVARISVKGSGEVLRVWMVLLLSRLEKGEVGWRSVSVCVGVQSIFGSEGCGAVSRLGGEDFVNIFL